MDSMISLTKVLNSSVESSDVLVGIELVMFLFTSERISIVVVGYISKESETVDLVSKGGELLVRASPPVLGAGTGAVSGIDVVFFLEVMAD